MFYQKDLVAVDIGSSCIKVIGLKRKQGHYYLSNKPYIENIPRGIVHQGTIEKMDELIDAMRMVVRKSKLFHKTKRCSLSISGNSAIVRRMEVELTAEISLGEQVKQVAEQFFTNFDELYWSYSMLNNESTPTQKSVVLCAAKIDVVERYVTLMRKLGFKVGVIDSSILCISNMFGFNYLSLPGLNIVLEMGASSSTIICFLNGQFCHSRIITIGGDYYSSCFSSDLGLDPQRAENLKLSVSQEGSVPPEVSKILLTVHESLAAEVNQAVEYFNRSYGMKLGAQQPQAQGLYLVGGASMIPGIAQVLMQKCGTKVHFVNPFHRIRNQLSRAGKEGLMRQSPLFGTCLGSGIRRVGDS